MILYRPVGLRELELIAQSGFRAFPPRLPEQPIFYPVLTYDYAERIAKEWNTTSGDFSGFITKFEVDDEYIQKHPVQLAGGRDLQELWVPAEELDEFNQHIIGKITIEAAFYGEKFDGEIDEATNLPPHIASQLLK